MGGLCDKYAIDLDAAKEVYEVGQTIWAAGPLFQAAYRVAEFREYKTKDEQEKIK